MKVESQPFRAGGVVDGAFFTDRADEVRRIVASMRLPGNRLLVYGARRMGKTSAIYAAARRAERGGVRVVRADLSTVSTAADAANRISAAVAVAFGRQWKDLVAEFVAGVGLRLTLKQEASGLLVPSFEVELRRAAPAEQLEALGRTLDAIDALSKRRAVAACVVLDEFQEISRIGGPDAEWHLRGRMQQHATLSYVLAGSQENLIRRMLESDRAFYKMLDVLKFGAIDHAHLARWIEDRMRSAGVIATGMGSRIASLANPRTQDVMQLARKSYERGVSAGRITTEHIAEAMEEIVATEGDLIRAIWEDLTPLQQNVLRAVAISPDGLTTGATIDRFALKSTGSATNAARSLIEKALLVRAESGGGYVFDSPFVRAWVLLNALPDMGIHPELPWRTADAV